MIEDNPKYPLFVYGTLRPGASKHHVARPFLKAGPLPLAILPGFQMYSFGPFPGILSKFSTQKPVEGNLLYFEEEQYEEAIKTIDQYEGEGWIFQRVQVTVRIGYGVHTISAPAWTYLIRPQALRIEESSRIESNNWFDHVRV